MDSALATTDHADVHAEHDHVALPQHRHHFETEEQQREAGSFGMWLFLLTEIMFFGGLFFAYLLYRNWYYPAFAVASNQLSVPLGGFNTAVPDHVGLLHGDRRVGGRDAQEGPAGVDAGAHDLLRPDLPGREV